MFHDTHSFSYRLDLFVVVVVVVDDVALVKKIRFAYEGVIGTMGSCCFFYYYSYLIRAFPDISLFGSCAGSQPQ
jgi:hypothetical protein